MIDKSLYFIAIIPPKEVYDVIKSHQKVMSERFGSYKSYNHIPHITLVPPFFIDEKNREKLDGVINSVEFKPFGIEVNGFHHFRKHTIFADIKSSEKLEKIHKILFEKLHLAKGLLDSKINYFQKYRPHITVGYRDLEPNFKAAWEHFSNQEIDLKFKVDEISLLKHDGERWIIQ